ncbi:MAG: nucleotidyltransferase family protein [Candidatus Kariarchaeaceae archaeon]|jgi:CTP:molybdopterin cytidylyltransferase MocA
MSTYSVIILAAGRSERFQSNKLLAKIDNQVLIERTLQPFYWLRSKIRKILVITGTFTDELRPYIEKFGAIEVYNPAIIIPTFEGRRGHPLLISSTIIGDVVKISDDNQGMRGYLNDNQEKILYLPLSNEGILKDIDKPDDIMK